MFRFFLIFPSIFLLLLPVTTGVNAQRAELSVSPATVSKEVVVNTLDEEFEDISTIRLTNTGAKTLRLQWNKEIESGPGQWQSAVLDKQPNYSPFVGNSQAQDQDQTPFQLRPSESADFFLVLRPNDIAGKGRITINFIEITQPNRILASSTFDLKVIDRKRTASPRATTGSLQLYPNPAVDNFFVEMPRNVDAGKVEVFNTLGRKLKSYPQPDPEKGYDISDLPEGIYLINVYDDQGKKLRTMRLFHRRFGGA
ncbi:hypothetical protein CEQ90_07345 [Lewinellaceae bacterium SD302]|nr:hypothetical protein CEQ90_07345 [Lewinellaceae bacterium SD302]